MPKQLAHGASASERLLMSTAARPETPFPRLLSSVRVSPMETLNTVGLRILDTREELEFLLRGGGGSYVAENGD